MTRFSTIPPSVTITTRALPPFSARNSIWRRGASVLGEITSPAHSVRPASAAPVSSMTSEKLRPVAAHLPSMLSRSSRVRSPPISSRASTKIRSPRSVGSRPADTCGANSSPASSRSAMTLRTVAGDNPCPIRRDSVRDPIGSPVSTKLSTICRKTSRERWLRLRMPVWSMVRSLGISHAERQSTQRDTLMAVTLYPIGLFCRSCRKVQQACRGQPRGGAAGTRIRPARVLPEQGPARRLYRNDAVIHPARAA